MALGLAALTCLTLLDLRFAILFALKFSDLMWTTIGPLELGGGGFQAR